MERFFCPTQAMPQQPQPRSADNYVNLITTPVSSLVKRTPITLPPHTSIRDAAQLMRDQRVSSVLIVQEGVLFGLITDRDLRNRVVAAGLDTSRPIMEIATLAPMTIDYNSHAFDALLMMARHNIHHVPVMDQDRVAGMITSTDLTEQQSNSAVYLAGAIYKQPTVAGLVEASARIKQLQQNLAAAEASAYSTGHIVSAITDALTSRLLQLGELKLGPAPVEYAWVAAGSQGRNEQTAKSDQDNCLVLDDAYDEKQHGEYFRDLARFVCDGLNDCGYVYCPGEMMAMTDAWRQPKQKWLQYFRGWIDQPDPKALMLTCVFFDQRFVYGKRELVDELRHEVLTRSKNQSLFLAFMVGNALTHQPPLNWLGNISLIKGGEHDGTVDLKHSGIVPITDLARVYALAGGSPAVNTKDRLENAAASGEITEQRVRDLLDALEYLSSLRLQHQARRMSDGHAADNHLRLEELSNFERGHLKEAFSVVKSLQGVLANRYPMGR
jgi:CBS domain-containing protein